MAGRKRRAQETLESLSREALSASEQARSMMKKKKDDAFDAHKFGGMSEEDVRKLQLPDHVAPGLDILFVSCRQKFLVLLKQFRDVTVRIERDSADHICPQPQV